MKKKILLVLSAILLFALPAYASDQPANTIMVEGSSTQEISPNQATLVLTIQNTNASAEAARSENAARASSLQAGLAALGISSDNIKTINFNIFPVYKDGNHGQQSEIKGYQVTNTVKVTVNDLSAIGSVIDSAVQNGANTIQNIRFSRQDELGFKKAVLAAAATDASAKAEAIAGALGKTISGISTVTENNVTFNVEENPYVYGHMLMKSAANDSTPIQPGSIKVQATVTIVFTIQ